MVEKKAPGVLIYFDLAPCLEMLTDGQCGALMKGVLGYAMTGAEPELADPTLRVIWCLLKPRVDADRAAYERKVEKARAAIQSRWAAREKEPADADAYGRIRTYPDVLPEIPTTTTTSTSTSTTAPTPTTTTTTASAPSPEVFSNPARVTREGAAPVDGAVEKTEGRKNLDREEMIFKPPTLEEVTAYAAERHSPVDPRVFMDFYASKGWRVGAAPMADWRAALRAAESWARWKKRPSNGPPSTACPPVTGEELARTRAAIEKMRGGGT